MGESSERGAKASTSVSLALKLNDSAADETRGTSAGTSASAEASVETSGTGASTKFCLRSSLLEVLDRRRSSSSRKACAGQSGQAVPVPQTGLACAMGCQARTDLDSKERHQLRDILFCNMIWFSIMRHASVLKPFQGGDMLTFSWSCRNTWRCTED